jgi:excisionase family DNA binding protein
MRNDLLTVDRVAEALELHPRTIRRFIREGRLKAKKLGKEWRVLRGDLDAFTGNERDDGAQVGSIEERVHVTAVVDISVASEHEADRIFTTMLAAVTGKGPEFGAVHYQSLYLAEEKKARLLFWGDAGFIGNALITARNIPSTLA